MTGPLFKWFGSKWLSAKKLPIPEYDKIFEPFAGSAGYSLRYADRNVTICEKDLYVYNLWKWLIEEATEASIREIPLNVVEGTDIRTLGLSAGQALLLKTWQRTNNVGGCWSISKWGSLPGQWTANTRARVTSEFHQIKHWKVLPDYRFIIESLDEATWFFDPPYQYNYQYRSDPIDYDRLATLIKSRLGQKIVCEAVCQKTKKVPTWLPFEFFGDRITSRRKVGENHHSKELIWHQRVPQ